MSRTSKRRGEKRRRQGKKGEQQIGFGPSFSRRHLVGRVAPLLANGFSNLHGCCARVLIARGRPMAIRIPPRESLASSHISDSSCASLALARLPTALHLNFTVPRAADIKETTEPEFNSKELIYGLIKGRRARGGINHREERCATRFARARAWLLPALGSCFARRYAMKAQNERFLKFFSLSALQAWEMYILLPPFTPLRLRYVRHFPSKAT